MEITGAYSIPTTGLQEALAQQNQDAGSMAREVREKIQAQMERVQDLQRKVRQNIDRGAVSILGAEQASAAVSAVSQAMQEFPQQAQAVQSRGVTSIGTFGVSYA